LQRVARMRRYLGMVVVVVLAGCAGVDAAPTAGEQTQAAGRVTQANCVTVGGGELQVGLALDFGPLDVRVAALQTRPGDASAVVGFTLETSAAGLRYAVHTGADAHCGDAADWVSPSGAAVTALDFCTGGAPPGCP
jgi:hypothetical protein